jgi:hypothetical protein
MHSLDEKFPFNAHELAAYLYSLYRQKHTADLLDDDDVTILPVNEKEPTANYTAVASLG